MNVPRFDRTARVVLVLALSLLTILPVSGVTIQEFFARRPDIPDNISRWSGQTDPVWILREWIKITTERNADYETAVAILNGQGQGGQPGGDPGTTPPPTGGGPSDGFGDPGSGGGNDDGGSPGGGAPISVNGYPRPRGDNGWGIHWFPTVSQSAGEVDRFVQLVADMHIKWVLFLNPGTDPNANVHLVRQLTGRGIMPVMRLYYSTINPPGGNEIEETKSLVRKFVDLGVPYFQIYNEPNLPCEWDGNRLPGDSISRWADAFIPRAKAVLAVGGIPGIGGPAFGWIRPDGSYGNGSEYFRDMIRTLVDRGEKALAAKCVLVIHNYTTDSHPSDQAQGEKHWQFRTYHDILAEFGLDLPMIGGEGGCRPEDVGGDRNRVADYTMWCYEYMPKAPSYYFCFTPWLLTAPEGNEWRKHAWFDGGGGELLPELISRMRRANPPVIAAGGTPAPQPADPAPSAGTPAALTPSPTGRTYAPRDGESWFPRDSWYDNGDLREAFMKKYGATTMNEALTKSMRKVCPNVGDSSAYTFECALGFYEIMEAMDLGGYTWGGDWAYPIPESAFDPWRKEGHKHMTGGREVGIKRVK